MSLSRVACWMCILVWINLCGPYAPFCRGAEDFPTTVLWATVKVVNPGSTATAVLIRSPQGKLVLLSANHVFESMRGDECTVILHRRDEKGSLQMNPKPLTIRREGKPEWQKHPAVDLAVMPVPFSEEDNLAILPWESLATVEDLERLSLQPGELVRAIGFPHGNAFKGSPLEFGVVRLGCLANYPILPIESDRPWLIDLNTFEGDSGGPVYVWDPHHDQDGNPGPSKNGSIVGIIVAQHFLDEEYKLIYSSGKTRLRLGMAIVLSAPLAREAVERSIQAAPTTSEEPATQ